MSQWGRCCWLFRGTSIHCVYEWGLRYSSFRYPCTVLRPIIGLFVFFFLSFWSLDCLRVELRLLVYVQTSRFLTEAFLMSKILVIIISNNMGNAMDKRIECWLFDTGSVFTSDLYRESCVIDPIQLSTPF